MTGFFKSEVGKSRDKDYKAYNEALNEALNR
jgi:hypothetical protein